MNNLNYLNKRINRPTTLDFGDIFSRSIDLFKKTWVQGLIHQIFLMVLMLPFIIAIYVPFILLMVAGVENGTPSTDVYQTFLAGFTLTYILFFIVAIILLSVISVALNAALFRIIKMIDHNEEVKTNDFFYFFKGKYFGKILGLILVSMLIAIPATLLCYLPIFYVMVPLSFFAIIFAFNSELSVGQIVSASFKLGNKKWLISFGLMIVSSFLASIVGMILCGIGIFFTAAFVYHPIYFIYKDVIGFEEEVEFELPEHFSEQK